MANSWATSAAVRKSMLANTRRDTKPELAVRRLLHAAGYRYRVDYAPLPSHRRLKADLVFTRARVAVFIDGCFWHGCPQHLYAPKTNQSYWEPKLVATRERDAKTVALFQSRGWLAIRFWEHENPAAVARDVSQCVSVRTPITPNRTP
ncbi:very short patch repair endonuclease [Rhodococcoides kroppenstedtii]